MEETNEAVVPKTTEEVTHEVTEDVVEEETVEILREKLKKAEEYGNNQKIRAEKAERRPKIEPKVEKPVETQSDLANSDIFTLVKANIHEDDIDRVRKFAIVESISIKDAIKNPELQAQLKVREEQRRVATATNTGPTRRSSTKTSDDVLLQNASQGKFPEDDSEIDRLVEARIAQNKSKTRK